MLFKYFKKELVQRTVAELEEGMEAIRTREPNWDDDTGLDEEGDKKGMMAAIAREIEMAKDPTTIYEMKGNGKVIATRPA